MTSYRRFNIVGTAGSGKSTFGRELAAVLAIPFFEMDQLFWKPGWRGSPDEEFMEKVSDVVAKDAWVLDGNYTRTVPIKWRRTQLVVWIDLPFMTTVARVTKRAVNRSITGTELWPGTGNRETLKKAFLSRRSIIWWSIKNLSTIYGRDCICSNFCSNQGAFCVRCSASGAKRNADMGKKGAQCTSEIDRRQVLSTMLQIAKSTSELWKQGSILSFPF